MNIEENSADIQVSGRLEEPTGISQTLFCSERMGEKALLLPACLGPTPSAGCRLCEDLLLWLLTFLIFFFSPGLESHVNHEFGFLMGSFVIA